MLFINRFGIGSRLTQSWAKIEMPGLAWPNLNLLGKALNLWEYYYEQ